MKVNTQGLRPELMHVLMSVHKWSEIGNGKAWLHQKDVFELRWELKTWLQLLGKLPSMADHPAQYL